MSSNNAQPVAQTAELQNGQMKEVSIDETKVLLVHLNDQFYALGANCTHYGAPLAKGILHGDRIICPWHKACFRATDGCLLEPPALDSLPHHAIRIKDGQIYVDVQESPAPAKKTQSADGRHFVIVGAGAAGAAALNALHDEDFGGTITIIDPEPAAPYDRTKLSKDYLSGNAGADKLPLIPSELLATSKTKRVEATLKSVNSAARSLQLSDNRTIAFDKLLIATGSKPQSLPVAGADLGNIFTLRSSTDADRILKAAMPGARVVVVGGSFIGMETASSLAQCKLPVTVVVGDQVPFARNFGPEVGGALQRWHESKGVDFRTKSRVDRFEGTGEVRAVVLASGERLPADLVLIGIGVKPAVSFSHDFKTSDDGGIFVDGQLLAAPDVYLAGDLAVVPDARSGEGVRIEHWRVAEQHGRLAAANMLGQTQQYNGVPFFWTNQFGTRFDYVGHAQKWDEVIIKGDLTKPEFIAYYIADGKVAAAAACKRDQDIALLHEQFRLNQLPTPASLR